MEVLGRIQNQISEGLHVSCTHNQNTLKSFVISNITWPWASSTIL